MAEVKDSAQGVDPIAIVGMGCRWPGEAGSCSDVDTPSALWEYLLARKNSYGDFPSDRLKLEAWYHPTANRPGSFYTRGGCFLKVDPRQFDPTFFGINPSEARSLDPAQRKMLEVVYEALESAGAPLEKVSGTKTGVFVGNFNYDHQLMQYRDTEYPEPYGMSGGGIALLSNRVSYAFNLQGPSLTLDTACSSSMYALHLACVSILSGECTAAIVAGSNLILSPECQIFSAALGAMSKVSRCQTFDAAADGYARADGIGALYIKPLRQALLDNDPIRAIIRGTAINANGRTGGITHPDPDGQEAAIRRAYERANLDPSETFYFECHGTGTQVGDPLEVEAVGNFFTKDKRSRDRPLMIGSIKSNMGHCEPASAIAGIMKTILALEHAKVPPIMGLQKLNPNLNLRDGRLKIVLETTAWPAGECRRASVNSFGYGGANGHAILEAIDHLAPGMGGVKARIEGPESHSAPRHVDGHVNGTPNNGVACANGTNGVHGHEAQQHASQKRFLLPFSAHSEATLVQNISALRECADKYDIHDLAFTLGCRRSKLGTRTFCVASQDTVVDALNADGLTLAMVKARGSSELKLGFVFSGQGAQWAQMGVDLMDSFPNYLQSIRNMDRVLQKLSSAERPDWTIEAALRQPEECSLVQQAAMSQPLVTAMQVALVDLLASWNIKACATIGHSSGEIGASYAAGLLSAAEAIVVAYSRGRSISRNPRKGAMLAVGANVDTVSPFMESLPSLTIACYNSPQSLTISGDPDDISSLKERLAGEGIFARVLHTGGNAYHSPHMNPLGAAYEDDVTRLLLQLPAADRVPAYGRVAFVSSCQSADFWTKEAPDARYWRHNLVSPVRFSQALSKMIETLPLDFLIEIGPHCALQGPIRQISQSLGGKSGGKTLPPYLATLIRREDGVQGMLCTAGTLFANGHDVDLVRVNSDREYDPTTNGDAPAVKMAARAGRVIVDLPKYQWQYNREYYFENRWTREFRLRSHPRHDLLGSRMPGGNRDEPVWRNVLKCKNVPWLQDHRVDTNVVFPATGYLAMAAEAALQAAEIRDGGHGLSSVRFEDVTISNALLVPEDEHGLELLTNLRPRGGDHGSRWEFAITSVMNVDKKDVFIKHCEGKVTCAFEPEAVMEDDRSDAGASKKPCSSTRWYDSFSNAGLNYGPTFQGLSQMYMHGNGDLREAEGLLTADPTKDVMKGGESRYLVHPAVLDSALQLAIIAHHRGRAAECLSAYLPVSIGSLSMQGSRSSEASHQVSHKATAKTIRLEDDGDFSSDFEMTSGPMVVRATGVTFVASQVGAAPRAVGEPDACFTRMEWKPDFDLLTTPKVSRMYPPASRATERPEVPLLEQLALHQLVQFHEQHRHFFTSGSHIPFLQRYLDWMAAKVELAREGALPGGQAILARSAEEREAEMTRLAAALMEHHGPETRLMVHMYESLPKVYGGEMTGIQAALQGSLLDDVYEFTELFSAGNRALADMVKLLSFKNPRLNILEVGAGTGSATKEVVPALRGHSALYRGYDSYTFTDITSSFLAKAHEQFKQYEGIKYATFDMQTPARDQGFEADYDLVIASNVVHATTDIQTTLANMRSLLKPGGHLALFELVQPRLSWVMILGTFSDFWNGHHDAKFRRTEGPFLTHAMWNDVLPQCGFRGAHVVLDSFAEYNEAAVMIARAAEDHVAVSPSSPAVPSQELALVYRKQPSAFVLDFARFVEGRGYSVRLLAVDDLSDNLADKRVVFLTEVDGGLFTTVTEDEWTGLKSKILSARSSLWVTSGSLAAGGQRPEHAMITGLASAFRTESGNSIRFLTADIELEEASGALSPEHHHRLETFEDLLKLAELADKETRLGGDTEFRASDGLMHVPRLLSDHSGLNEAAHKKKESRDKPELVPYSRVEPTAFVLALDKAGDAVHLEEARGSSFVEEEESVLHDGQVLVKAKSLHFGKQPFMDSCPSGSRSRYPRGGVFFGTVQQVGSAVTTVKPGDSVCGITIGRLGNMVREKAELLCKVPGRGALWSVPTLASCLARYAVSTVGRVQKGDSVLIRSNSGEFAFAAYQLARRNQADLVSIQISDQDANILAHLGVPDTDIFVSDGKSSTTPRLLQSSSGRGFDLVVTDGAGDDSKDGQLLAPLGRLVKLGGESKPDRQHGGGSRAKTNTTVTCIDFGSAVRDKPTIIAELMAEARKDVLTPYPAKAFNMTQLSEAFAAASSGTTTSVLGLDAKSADNRDGDAQVPFAGGATEIAFDGDASYVLVGCLGGLGRSFTNWMVQRGARSFIFLSRSGATSPIARKFLATLNSTGVKATAVQGDVANKQDVVRAVRSSSGPIKGVIQAPLELNDAFFDSMTLADFNKTMRPRVLGTINMHEAVLELGAKLDFFVTWSSWTSILGSPSQGNYMASNAFMDAFAQHRLSLGLPATSLSLGHMLDVGIVSHNLRYQEHLNRMGLYGNSEREFLQFCEAAVSDSRGHLLAGLTPSGLLQHNARYPVADMAWRDDARFSHLLSAFGRLQAGGGTAGGAAVPDMADDDERSTLVQRIHRRVARLLFVSTDDIDRRQPIRNYGIDSMVAAELRNWLLKATGLNVTLLELLHPTCSVEKLSARLEKKLLGNGNGNGEASE